MFFVGRKREIKKIIKSLQQGRNVVVMGKYGIGRTSLIRQVSGIKKDTWHFMFVDFSDPPAKMCRELLSALLPEKRFTKDQIFKRNKWQNFKTSLFLIVNDPFKDSRKHIIVFDNIAKTTPQKLTFIRNLAWAKRFQFIAIVEPFLSEKELFSLRAQLIPADILELANLSVKETCEFFKEAARKNKLNWPEKHIRMLASAAKGYPLGMKELMSQESAREKSLNIEPQSGFLTRNPG